MQGLRRLRKRALLSVKQLAEQVGVNRQTLYLWERGETWPRAEYIPRLAQALRVEVKDVLDALEETAKHFQAAS